MFTVDITDFLAQECMRDYSASVAEIGADAGAYTWQACAENAPDWQFLKPENMDDFRDYVRSFGAWGDDEIASWEDAYLQALCLQCIAGDARDCGADKPGADWQAIRNDQESGHVNSNIYAQDGRIFWECTQ